MCTDERCNHSWSCICSQCGKETLEEQIHIGNRYIKEKQKDYDRQLDEHIKNGSWEKPE